MKKLACIPALMLVLGFILFSCNNNSTGLASAPSKDSLIKRGAYLVTTMGCNDCHSPKKMGPNGPEPDPDRLLSGHPAGLPLPPAADTTTSKNWLLFNPGVTAFVGPWGTSFAANLTSDPTGMGGWTIERFSKALREGKYNGIEGTRAILPPMPWPNYTHVSDQDLLALFTYLQSTKPVKNLVPQPIPPGAVAKK